MATHAYGFHLNHPYTFEMADKSEKNSRSAVRFNSSEPRGAALKISLHLSDNGSKK